MFCAGRQIKRRDVRTLSIDPALQHQRDRALLGRQAGVARDLITVLQIALSCQLNLIELQGVRQIGTGLEAIRRDFHLCGQVLHQRLQLPAQLTLQITTAICLELQSLEQITLNVQGQRPRLITRCRQLQLTLGCQRPVAVRLQ